MNQEFDQLFRDKLQNHEEQPSAKAWAKLRSKLPRKDRKPFFFVAFGILLCGMGLGYWYFGMGLTKTQNLEKTEKVEKNTNFPEANKNTKNQSVLERANLEEKPSVKHDSVPNLERKGVLEEKNLKQVLQKKIQTEKVLEKKVENGKEVKTVLEEKMQAKSENKTENKVETNLENQAEKTEKKPNEVRTEVEPEMPITVIIKTGDQASNRQEPLHEKDSLIKKKPRFLRILKQLHNFKEGEKVNFQDLKRDKK